MVSSFGFQLNFFLHWGPQLDLGPRQRTDTWHVLPSLIFLSPPLPSTKEARETIENSLLLQLKKGGALEYQLYQSEEAKLRSSNNNTHLKTASSGLLIIERSFKHHLLQMEAK